MTRRIKTQTATVEIGGRHYKRRGALAAELGISVRTLERWALIGEGPPFASIGRIRLYPTDEVDRFIRSRLVISKTNGPQ